jgi:hypothetical protein
LRKAQRKSFERLLFLVRSSVTANHAQDPSPPVIWATSERHDSGLDRDVFGASQGPRCPSLTRCGGYLAVSCDDVALGLGTTETRFSHSRCARQKKHERDFSSLKLMKYDDDCSQSPTSGGELSVAVLCNH